MDAVSIICDPTIRAQFLAFFRTELVRLQHERDAINTEKLHKGDKTLYMSTYNLALKRFDENAKGTNIQQILLVYILFFYTTHTESFFAEITSLDKMNTIMAATQILPDGSVRILSELYDRCTNLVDGNPDATSYKRDYKDMRCELLLREHNPLTFTLNEMMRVIGKYKPQSHDSVQK
jgi:hypothetical protein